MSNILKKIEKHITDVERQNSFDIRWYSIFMNPFFITRRALAKETRMFASRVGSEASVLDVGCGSKPYREFFKTSHYTGIDIQGGGLEDSTKGQDAFFDGENIPFPDASFDVVIATEVLEHALSPEKLVAEMCRVLKKNGLVFITVPFVWPEHGQPYDFRRLTSFGHNKILSEAGFGRIETHKTTGIFATCGQVISDFIINTFHNWIHGLLDSRSLKYKIKFIAERLVIFLVCMPIQAGFLALDGLFGHRGVGLDFASIAHKQ